MRVARWTPPAIKEEIGKKIGKKNLGGCIGQQTFTGPGNTASRAGGGRGVYIQADSKRCITAASLPHHSMLSDPESWPVDGGKARCLNDYQPTAMDTNSFHVVHNSKPSPVSANKKMLVQPLNRSWCTAKL